MLEPKPKHPFSDLRFPLRRTVIRPLMIKNLYATASSPFPSIKLDFDNSKTVNAPQLVKQCLNISNVSDNNNVY